MITVQLVLSDLLSQVISEEFLDYVESSIEQWGQMLRPSFLTSDISHYGPPPLGCPGYLSEYASLGLQLQ
jgi:hypothetical protein